MAEMEKVRWRRVICVYVVGIALSAGTYFVAHAYYLTPATRAAPSFTSSLTVDSQTHDFGRVAPGAVLEHAFRVRNHGATRVVLNRVEGCNCGDDSAERTTVLAAGGEANFPVRLEAGVMPGRVRRTLSVTTSDPRRPRLEFTLTANVIHAPAAHGVPTEAR
jgi:hypothetical protein